MSKKLNNRLAVKIATDSRYKFLKNGTIKKLGSDGKYRAIGTERHGYNVITYAGTKLVTARVLVAKGLIDAGFDATSAVDFLNRKIVAHVNGNSLDDSRKNIYTTRPSLLEREKTKRLSQKQIDRMIELFFDGFSVAKIARRFRRKISRSNVSRVIRRELGIETVGG
jgi:hypothetical protein